LRATLNRLYSTIRRILTNVGYDLVITKIYPDYVEPEFARLYDRFRDVTMLNWQAAYMTYKAAEYVAVQNIEGDIVECGVWKGGATLVMADTLFMKSSISRNFYLYDTFQGMSEPTESDHSFTGPAVGRYRRKRRGTFVDWAYASIDDVRKNMRRSEYPFERFIFVPGMVERTIPSIIPDRIALLRLDTDFYESTRHELRFLYPRLSVGGILICDDYRSWHGARKAFDEYFLNKRGFFYVVDSGSGRAIGVKLSEEGNA